MEGKRLLLKQLAIGAAGILICLQGHAAERRMLLFSSGEQVPYVGATLPGNGYAAEVLREAFARMGYDVKIAFYPWARAKRLAETGDVDGVLPVLAGDPSAPSLHYSQPYPGDTVGLLKRKDFKLAHAGLRAGVVRGSALPEPLSTMRALVFDPANDDVQNLDKLDRDRIQLAVIDRYTAADLMVNLRPHLIGRFEFLPHPLVQRQFHVGFSLAKKDAAALAAAFNEGLSLIRRDGTLERIMKRHGLYLPMKQDPRKVQLVIGTVNNADMERMQSLSAEYERSHPDVRLAWRVLDENTLRLRLLSDLAIGDGQFDIMTIGTYEAPIWAQRGWLVPLSPQESYDADDIIPAVRQGLSLDGKLYALPFYAESSMTFFRKDLFAGAGLVMPSTPTYADIARFAAALHDPGKGVYGICLRGKAGWGENMALVSTMVNVHGGRWFDESWHPELDTPPWEAALTLYKDLLQKYGPPEPERNGFNENLRLFAQGGCAMWIDATVAAGMLFDPRRSRVSSALGFAAAPTAVTGTGAAWLWSWALAVPSSSAHQKQAAEFIAWATSKEYVQTVARQYGWLAAPPGTRKSTYLQAGYANAAPFAQFVSNAIERADLVNSTAKPKPYVGIQYAGIPEFPAIGNMAGEEIAKVLRGEQTVVKALSRAQEKASDQMKASGYVMPR